VLVSEELEQTARAMLKQAHLYCTSGRVAVLKVLLQAGGPMRQDQIAAAIANRRYNKVTIYRTLAALVEAGLVHTAFVQKRARHFELAERCTETQCHPHFTCTRCGRTHCLFGMNIPMARSPYKGFIIQRQQVRFEGLCPRCV